MLRVKYLKFGYIIWRHSVIFIGFENLWFLSQSLEYSRFKIKLQENKKISSIISKMSKATRNIIFIKRKFCIKEAAWEILRNYSPINKWKIFQFTNIRLILFHFLYLLLGTYSVYFVATSFEESKSITIQTNSYFLFHSSFSISFHELCNCSALQIEHNFNIDSMLFQNILGDLLRKFLEERLQRALENLKLMLYNLQSEGLLTYWE